MTPPPDPSVAAQTVSEDDPDASRLRELGYTQELRRSMSAFSNFAVSFTIISVLSGCLTLYGRHENRRTGGDRVGLAGRRRADPVRRPCHGRGVLGLPVAMIAVTWVAVITILFMLPPTSPVTPATFNYSSVAVLVVLGFAGIWWLVSARRWFTGSRRMASIEELIELERRTGEGS